MRSSEELQQSQQGAPMSTVIKASWALQPGHHGPAPAAGKVPSVVAPTLKESEPVANVRGFLGLELESFAPAAHSISLSSATLSLVILATENGGCPNRMLLDGSVTILGL